MKTILLCLGFLLAVINPANSCAKDVLSPKNVDLVSQKFQPVLSLIYAQSQILRVDENLLVEVDDDINDNERKSVLLQKSNNKPFFIIDEHHSYKTLNRNYTVGHSFHLPSSLYISLGVFRI